MLIVNDGVDTVADGKREQHHAQVPRIKDRQPRTTEHKIWVSDFLESKLVSDLPNSIVNKNDFYRNPVKISKGLMIFRTYSHKSH